MKQLLQITIAIAILSGCTTTVSTPKVAEEVVGTYWSSNTVTLDKKINKETAITSSSVDKSISGVTITKSSILDEENAVIEMYLITNGVKRSLFTSVINISRTKSKTGTVYNGYHESSDGVTLTLTIQDNILKFVTDSPDIKISMDGTKI